jgi:pilus assembly protein CpaE
MKLTAYEERSATMSGNSGSRVRLLLLEDGQGQAERLRGLLRDEHIDLSVASPDFDGALQQVRSLVPDVMLVALLGGRLPDVVERLDAVSGGNPIVVLVTPEQSEHSREVLLAGARTVLPADVGRDELVDTLHSILERDHRRRAALAKEFGVEVDLGHVIAVHGAKGGVGATAVSVNLAIATLQATRRRVALVDANLYSGDVAASLNLMSRNSLADLTPHLKELDRDFLDRAAVHHASGVRVFLAPDDFVRAQVIEGEHIARILKVMRQQFDYIIVDTCSLPDQVTSAALEEADRILLITTPELPALKNAARFLRLAGDFGYRSKIDLVLNRGKSRGAIGNGDIESHLHAPIRVTIGSDGRTVPAAMNAGEPVIGQRRSRFSSGIWALTAMITGAPVRKLKRTREPATAARPENGARPLTPIPVRQLNLAGDPAAMATPERKLEVAVQPEKSLLSRFRNGR